MLFDLEEANGVLSSEETMSVAMAHDLLARDALKRLKPYITFV
jgi:hypothetical protein